MARRNSKTRRAGKKMTLPVAVVVGFMPGIWRMWSKKQDFNLLANEAGRIYLGYDSWTGQFSFGSMKFGTLPIILGGVVHKLANMLGVNRALGAARIPFIRI